MFLTTFHFKANMRTRNIYSYSSHTACGTDHREHCSIIVIKQDAITVRFNSSQFKIRGTALGLQW